MLVRNPPTTGPNATPSIRNIDIMPRACPRTAGERYVVIMTAPSAEITAPPIPCSMRARMSALMFGAIPQNMEPSVKRKNPIRNILRYPFMSPRREAARRRLTMTIR